VYSAPIIKRVLQIIQLIVQDHKQFGVTQISQTLSINKSTVFGILKALQAEGFIVKDPATKKYTMGPGLFELSARIFKRTDLASLAHPFLEQLAERVGETVILGARQEHYVKFLEVIEAKKDLKISSHVGAKIPLTAGATGKVILSFMEESEIAGLFREKGLPQFTEKSVTDLNLFLGEIAKVRKQGYAVDFDEYLKGTTAVAAPIRAGKRLIGIVWVVSFTSATDEKKVAEIVEQVTDTTKLIGRAIESVIVPIYSGNFEEMMRVLIGPTKSGEDHATLSHTARRRI
jgi:DNA-binding IclR family transcriptional regulator